MRERAECDRVWRRAAPGRAEPASAAGAPGGCLAGARAPGRGIRQGRGARRGRRTRMYCAIAPSRRASACCTDSRSAAALRGRAGCRGAGVGERGARAARTALGLGRERRREPAGGAAAPPPATSARDLVRDPYPRYINPRRRRALLCEGRERAGSAAAPTAHTAQGATLRAHLFVRGESSSAKWP